MLSTKIAQRSPNLISTPEISASNGVLPLIETFENLLLINNPKLYQHSKKVSALAEAIGSTLSLDPEDLKYLRIAGLLHDISLIGLDSFYMEIAEPKRLNDRTKVHPELSFRILHSLAEMDANLEPVILGIRYHHENFDGSGYPFGLRGEKIPLEARILRVAEFLSYLIASSLTSNGNLQNIKYQLLSASSSKFDPCIVSKILEENILEKFLIQDAG